MEHKRKTKAATLGGSLTSTVMQNRRVCNKKTILIHKDEIVGFFQNEFSTRYIKGQWPKNYEFAFKWATPTHPSLSLAIKIF
jgi:hypothetical protein